jgi:aminoglycoside phosphotransferase (APT) family kinase protein
MPRRFRSLYHLPVARVPTMHDDEIAIDADLVARLVAAQFPQWASAALEPLSSSGTDNAIFRLGDDKAVRLPRIAGAVGQVEQDRLWLPALAPHLPFAIPELLETGAPSDDYPWEFGVYRWLEGEPLAPGRLDDALDAARDVARLLQALRRIDTRDAPASGRGGPLAPRDEAVRRAIVALGGRIDTGAATRSWDTALAAPAWEGPPTWLHGDLMPGNLLFAERRLAAVIDFSVLGVGDPAADLMVAWWLLNAETRAQLRSALAVDEASWTRGRGWALSCALIALPYYSETNPTFASYARRALAEVLSER